MVLVKCILAGLLSVFLAAILAIVVITISLSHYRPEGAETVTIGFDPVTAARTPLIWVGSMVVFALGFYLEYRRAE